MSWQDELAQLDSALASGQISADEYRTRRDRVIAQASGQSAPEPPQQQQSAEPTQVFRPVNPAQQPPQQPTFGERTQAVGQQGQVGDRTQVVGRGNDADSTQIVSNMPPTFPPRPAPPPWETLHPQQQSSMTPPPWANEELPPEFGQQSWPRQGPEVFEEKSGGGGGKTVGIVIAVVLVLALAGGAIWFFGFRDKGDDNQAGGNGGGGTSQEQSQETTTTTEEPNLPEGPFIELPGEEVLNRTVPMSQAITDQQPTKDEAALLQSVGVSDVGGLVTEDNGLRRGIWAFKLGPDSNPSDVLNAMDGLYQQAQFELVSNEDGVLVRKQTPIPPSDQTVFRAHYITDGYLVRVEVYGADSANVESEFNDLIAKEKKEFPPAS